MQRSSTVMLFLLAAAFAPASAEEASPIGKILQMIGDLQAKVIKEGEEAQSIYTKFAEYCEDRSKDLGYDIKTGKAEVETLKATIDEQTSLSASLNTKIDELSSSIASDEADLKAATEIREKENADFVAEEKELMSIIDMLERATGILEREMAKSGASFIQNKNVNSITDALAVMLQASAINQADVAKLTAFVQSSQGSEDSDLEAGAPDAAVYEGQSGNIIDTLNKLSEDAEAQLADARKKETKSKQEFEMLKQSLTDEITFATKDMDKAKTDLAASSETKSTAEGDLATTSKDLSADVAAKADLHQECMTKAEDFEMETKSRAEELKALAEAKKIIAETTGAADSNVYGSSFIQTGLKTKADLKAFEIVRMVRDMAHKNRAPALAQLAQRLDAVAHSRSGEDVFAKIKGLIADMIDKLEKEAEEDASHKAYCDKEMSETEEKKADKEAEIKKLTTSIDKMTADSAQLKEEVSELQASLAALSKSQSDADKIRAEEKALFEKTSEELSLGIEGVKKALAVLTAYYAKEDKSHSSADGAGAGIIGLLEVCESDFSKELAEITSVEETAAADYDKTTKENEVEKTMKTQDVKYKTKESKDLDKAVAEASTDKSTVSEELDAVLDYYARIKEECIAKAEPYAEIKARREAEIKGLKEALEVLESETALVQKRSVRRQLRGVSRQGVIA